jgi:hypothetical protein
MDTSDLGQVDELKFNSHISNICKKASMKLNVIRDGSFDFNNRSSYVLWWS